MLVGSSEHTVYSTYYYGSKGWVRVLSCDRKTVRMSQKPRSLLSYWRTCMDNNGTISASLNWYFCGIAAVSHTCTPYIRVTLRGWVATRTCTCRKGGYLSYFFSFRYLHIQLEKDNPNYEPNYDDALSYIAQLPFEAVGQLKVTATYRTGGGGRGGEGHQDPPFQNEDLRKS